MDIARRKMEAKNAMRHYGRIMIGLFLIVIGALSLLDTFGYGEFLAGSLVALVGIGFLGLYHFGRQSWALYPGAFTAPVGIVIMLATQGLDMEVWWPLFIAAPGLSFIILRFAGAMGGLALSLGVGLLLLAAVMFAISTGALSWLYVDVIGKLWPVVLILAGLVLIIRSFGPRYTQGGQGSNEER